jgi:hypothetical protein
MKQSIHVLISNIVIASFPALRKKFSMPPATSLLSASMMYVSPSTVLAQKHSKVTTDGRHGSADVSGSLSFRGSLRLAFRGGAAIVTRVIALFKRLVHRLLRTPRAILDSKSHILDHE